VERITGDEFSYTALAAHPSGEKFGAAVVKDPARPYETELVLLDRWGGVEKLGIATYTVLGLAPLAAFTLFLLAWTSADNQLYSASLSWSVAARAIGRIVDRRKLVLVGAVVTILLSFTKLHLFAVQWLSLLTVVSLPAGIVVWTDYFIVRRGWSGGGRRVNLQGFVA